MKSRVPRDAMAGPTREGVVLRKSVGLYSVRVGDEIIECAISSKLRKDLVYWWATSEATHVHVRVKEVRDIREVDPVAIGDRVRFVDAPGDGRPYGLIVEVLPRTNKLSRLAAGLKPIEQVIVANVDQVIPVFAVRKPKPKWVLLDRYLAAVEATEVPALICLTKSDLLRDHGEITSIVELYEGLGYRTMLTSSATGQGIAAFAEAIRGCVSVLFGKSGVGKSSLLNSVQPGLGLAIKEVNKVTGKGKHATSHLEMYPLDGGGGVVDTPGMREFGLWPKDEEGGLAGLFVEMRPHIGACRFGLDCSHTHEPDCAVKEAVEAGEIAGQRYRSYARIFASHRRVSSG